MVKTFSKKKDGNKKVAEHFSVYEWACPSGLDEIKIDLDLPPYLEVLRGALGLTSMEVISGYRTQKYNDSLPNSSKTSQHLQGKAADIRGWLPNGKYIDPKYLCCAAEVLGMTGIGVMQTSIHVDVRPSRSWFDENFKNTRIENLPGNHKSWFTYYGIKDLKFFKKNPFNKPTGTDISKMTPNEVRYVQFELVKKGYLPLIAANGKCNIDGVAGTGTKNAVIAAGLKALCK